MQRIDPTEKDVREQVLAKLGGCGIEESRVAVFEHGIGFGFVGNEAYSSEDSDQ